MAVIIRNGTNGKVCSRCRKWKPLTEFPKDRTHGTSQGGTHCRCKECHREIYHLKKVAIRFA